MTMRFLDRRLAAAVSLVLGGLAFSMFWLDSALASDEADRVIVLWPIQLGFHGIAILLLSLGFILVGRRLVSTGWRRRAWQFGAGLVVVGLWPVLLLLMAGLFVVGLVEVLSRGDRLAGPALTVGSALWMVVYARGVRIGFEDGPPLDDLERYLSAAGLVLISVGIVAVGIAQLRARTAVGETTQTLAVGPSI